MRDPLPKKQETVLVKKGDVHVCLKVMQLMNITYDYDYDHFINFIIYIYMYVYIYISRANAPTGSAGEESVSSCWVAVAGFWWFLVVVVVVVVVARRARQTHTQKLTQTARARARARREPAHMRKEQEPSQNHGIYDVFAASEKAKIEDKDSETTKTLYFTMFWACRVRTLAFRKVLKTS